MLRLALPLIIATTSAATFAAAIPAADGEFFEKHIRPILISECVECHGVEKQKGGLRLDYRDGWKKGGDTGAAIIPGDPKKSLLIESIRHEDPDLKMPSKRPKLSDAVIADFEKWIAMGAPDPRDEAPKEAATAPWETLLAVRKEWWSLQPVVSKAPPAVRHGDWSANPVDRFLLAGMEAKDLAPTRDADPHTMIRRLSYTLTGLPPTPEEVAQFVAAAATDSGAAITAATDRLLASPRFGERWARHWMDLVRYAETHGSEGDPEIPFAWRYRDYLIRAFNDDVPWDRLIREHIAGDLLAEPRWNKAEGWNESMLGIAHLRLVEHGFQPVDTRDEQVKTVDSQIDVLTKAFQGLTVSCARCHDHKFDAVSQRDFYALAGIMESTRPAMVTIDAPERLAHSTAELRELKAKIKTALTDAWLAESAKVPAHLLGEQTRSADIAALNARIAEAEGAIAKLDGAVKARILAARGNAPTQTAPPVSPIARWSFDTDSRDHVGQLHGATEGDAEVRDGGLLLKGKGHFRSAPLGRKLRAKTLEAWVSPATLDQAGGGVITVEDAQGNIFDSLVFAEKEPRRWMAGSNFFIRGKSVNGPQETADTGTVVHLAITYHDDGTIAMFRNGVPFGEPWQVNEQPAVEFAPDARVLIGLRHTPAKGNGYFRGNVAEARLYDRALNAAEISASFKAGSDFRGVSDRDFATALTPQEQASRAQLTNEVTELRTRLKALAPEGRDTWSEALADAEKNRANPLWHWRNGKMATADHGAAPRSTIMPEFFYGPGVMKAAAGEFTVRKDGDAVISGLSPEAISTGLLTTKHGGIATTRRFKVETDFISIHAAGNAAQCRLIVDGYPLGTNPIFPRAQLNDTEPKWHRMDVKYRKGSWAYLEFATSLDLTRPEKRADDSWFSVESIVAHDGDGPRDSATDFASLLGGTPGADRKTLALAYGNALRDATNAWRAGKLTEPQRALLDFFVGRKLLPCSTASIPALQPIVAEYRRIEAAVPVPRRSPGVIEAQAYDSPLLTRGEHLQPAAEVPRGFLGVLGHGRFDAENSARLELANAIADPRNPLTARVMVNRIWHWVFGRGIVPTPDNLGKMGEAPTHPELLDFLAAKFVADGWSPKQMIRFLVNTRAYRLASEPSPASRERDPGNALLSHFRVQRLDAESIRDTLLTLGPGLDLAEFGPPANANAPRRSVYLNIRRTALNPFLTTFDAPQPFSTLGKRDATNVPGQSLTLMNDPFVINAAERWAQRVIAAPHADPQARVNAMFVSAFAHAPSAEELAQTTAFISDLAATQKVPPDQLMQSQPVWRDVAHALFNLKDFIYVR